MKKGIHVIVLVIFFSLMLMGTAMARPFDENMVQWLTVSSTSNDISAYADDSQKVDCLSLSHNQDSDTWQHCTRFTRFQQAVEFAGYRANLTLSIASMLIKTRGFAPTLAFKFVW